MTITGEWTEADVNALRAVLDPQGRSLERVLESLTKLIPSDRVKVFDEDPDRQELVPIGRVPHSRQPTDDATVPARHAMTVSLRSAAGAPVRVTFFRARHDFDARERMLLALLRPHLDHIYRNATGGRHGAERLTPRQRMVLQMVAGGMSNHEVAAHLSVSTGTVRTHLDNIFRQLGVSSRTAAVVRAFPHGVPALAASTGAPPRHRGDALSRDGAGSGLPGPQASRRPDNELLRG